MKCRFVIVMLLLGFPYLRMVQAAGDYIPMNADEVIHHNIQTAVPQPALKFSTEKFPAEVVVPNAQRRVISAPQSGLLEVMLIAAGETVAKDQVLARIRSPDLITLQSELLQTQNRLHLARINLERDEQLYNEGIIAERRFFESRSKYHELVAVMTQRRHALLLAGMTDVAIDKLERTRQISDSVDIRSPIKGVIMEQMAVAGQRIEAATPLYKVAWLDPLWLEIHVPLPRLRHIKLGDAVRVPETNATGRIITIGSEVHPADQGVLLRAEVIQGTDSLRPGQFVQAIVLCDCESADSYALPRSAIVHLEQRTLVFVKTETGYIARDVTIEQETGEYTIVSGEINPETDIVISGTATLKATLSGIGGGAE